MRVFLFALMTACSSTSDGEKASLCDERTPLVAAMSSHSASGIAQVRTSGIKVTLGADLGGDLRIASSQGRLFAVARDTDTIFELDANCGSVISKRGVGRTSAGLLTNPQDVAATSTGDLWIPKFNVPEILVVSKDGQRETMDTRPFDSDANPQAHAAFVIKTPNAESVYVSFERLPDSDFFNPSRRTLLGRFDFVTRKPVSSIELLGRNAFGSVHVEGTLAYFAMAGNMRATNETDAGVEVFDAIAQSSRLLVKENQIGASVIEVRTSGMCGAAIAMDATPDVNKTAIVTFRTATGQLDSTFEHPTFGPTEGFDLEGLAWNNGVLYVGDRRRSGSGYPIRTFARVDAITCKLIEKSPIASLPLPATALASP